MVSYLNVHSALEARRSQAQSTNGLGPRVMLVGPVDVGKSSLSKLLVGYAVRRGRRPIFVDLDIGQGQITIPGVIAATPVERPVHPVEGFSYAVPLAYYYGHANPTENPKLLKALVSRLANQVHTRLQQDPVGRSSGLILNTMGWVEGLGYDILVYSIAAFQVDVVLVLGHERLFVDLNHEFQGKNVSIVKLNKSGGVVTREPSFRRRTRNERMRDYFYGVNGDLCPHSTILGFNSVSIYRAGGGPVAPTSALPIGATSLVDPTRLVEIQPSRDLVHSVLAVSHAPSPDFLLDSNIAGFIYVSDVDVEKQKITCVAPSPGPLPSRYLIAGSLKWLD
mmetsp:Transcript_13309/g.22894  ORF Transcript_13309/g.22894 Transcript_13309/m.22894 type:complete len:336 (+) Transcript_13309:365-1372(+)